MKSLLHWLAKFRPGLPLRSISAEFSIRDFFVFRDVLFVRGRVQRLGPHAPVPYVQRWDGTLHAVNAANDDFNASDTAHWSFHFHHALPAGTPFEHLQQIQIIFQYPDGRLEVSSPAQPGLASDPFLNSEGPFWGAVQARPQANVLEIGSRARSGISRRHLFPASCAYTGFDILPGENVTVVGDAHALSQTLPTEHFDFVFSVSVWEHLAMPWLVSLELNKVMKTGALAMINTHQSWPVHEVPWDYFRFSDFAWDSLFNAATGFEIVGRGMGMPCVMGPSLLRADSHASRVEWHYGCLASRVLVRKIGPTTLTWPVDLSHVSRGIYPH